MRGPQSPRVASWLASLLLLACTSQDAAPPATSEATPETPNASAAAAPAAAAQASEPATGSQAPPAAAASLAGTSWQLVRFEGGDGTVLLPDDSSKYTLEFGADGNVAVRLDCNRGRGTWKEPQPGALELGPLALTRAACPPGSLHDQIARHWTYVRSYVTRNGHLHLSLMADGGIYEFEPMTSSSRPAGAQSTASLTNTYWKLLTLDGAAVDFPPEAREVHLILQIDQQRVSGFSGCNRLMGGYKVDGDRLTFSQMAGTMMACAPPSMNLERNFHVMLQKVARWRINGERLDLLDDSGAVLAGFESRYMQ